ncbi:MAG: AsmA family protein [Methyloceanibacter sp.]
MKVRQLPWKWLLLGLMALLLAGIVALPRQIGDSSRLRDRIVASLADWTGATVTLTEPLRVNYFPSLSLRGGIVLTNASHMPLVQSVTARDVKISLSLPDLLLGRTRIEALRLSKPKFTLKAEAATKVSTEEMSRLAANMLGGELVDVVRVRDGTIATVSGGTLVDQLDARFDTSEGDGSLSALGSFAVRGELVHFAIDSGVIGAASESGEAKSRPTAPVRLRITSEPVTAKFTGTASLAERLLLNGNMLVEMEDVRKFLRWTGVALAEGQSMRALSADGTVHWSGSTLTFDQGSYSLDGNSADGLLAITIGERPRLEGTLDFEYLTLGPYLRSSEADKEATQKPLFDWALLKYLDADLRISAEQVTASTMTLGRSGFTITAKEGRIASEIGELELCGGQAAGRLGLDVSEAEAKASVVGSLTDIAMDNCLMPLGLGVRVRGLGSLRTDLTTEGFTIDELVSGLSGDLKVQVQNGSVPVDFPRLLGASTSLSGDGWSKDRGTPFGALDADCRLAAGHIWCQTFSMETSRGRISGSGDIDIGRKTINWDFLLTNPIAPLMASQLVRDTHPRVTITGPLLQPQIRRADRPNLGGSTTQSSP